MKVVRIMIIKLELKNHLKSLLIWIFVLSILIIGIASFLPSMETESMQSLVNMKIEGIPESVLAAFGISNMPNFGKPSVMYGYIYQYINLAIGIYMVLLGGNILVGEESDGTIEYLYAQPISRKKIYIEKLLAGIIIAFLLLLSINIVGIVSLNVFKSDVYTLNGIIADVIKIFAGSIFTSLVFLSFGFFTSACLKTTKSVSGIAMGLVFGSFILGVIGEIVEKYNFLGNLSPLGIMSPMDIIEKAPDAALVGLWSIGGVVLITIGYIIYNRKDFNI